MKKTIYFLAIFITITVFLTATICNAQPYGKGLYNADVPYGGQTSLSISTDGGINIPTNPATGGALSTGTSIVTVTSTDVKGYKLYIRAQTNTSLVKSGATIAASANGSAAPLATNTWGYNVNDASSNFIGITLTDVQIRSLTGPARTGDVTNIKYGVNLDLTKPIGTYSTDIVYTAVPQTD